MTALHLIFMGVSGSGKSTVARAVQERLGWEMAEGDDFHPPENVAKMREGTPLTERGDWYAGVLPDRITVYRGPTLRLCEDREEVVREVEITVVHEIAHHFGIDDERLHALGYG